MTKTKSLLILIFTLLFSNYYLPSFTKEITITTYYPSPVGIYKELRAKRMAIGDNYYNPSDYSWGDEIPNDADLVVEGKVGIGTNDPEKELHVAGDTEIEGGVVIGNPTGGNKGIGTINAQKIYVDGTEIGGGRSIDVWVGSDSDSDYQSWPTHCSVSCTVSVPEGYTVIYAHKKCASGYKCDYCNQVTHCAYPSFLDVAGGSASYSCACNPTNLGDVGPINITTSCTAGSGSGPLGWCRAGCGIYVIAIKIK